MPCAPHAARHRSYVTLPLRTQEHYSSQTRSYPPTLHPFEIEKLGVTLATCPPLLTPGYKQPIKNHKGRSGPQLRWHHRPSAPATELAEYLAKVQIASAFDAIALASWGGGGGVLDVMHGHSPMTMDPRILTMPGRSTSGFPRPDRYCLHQARSCSRIVFLSSWRGVY